MFNATAACSVPDLFANFPKRALPQRTSCAVLIMSITPDVLPEHSFALRAPCLAKP